MQPDLHVLKSSDGRASSRADKQDDVECYYLCSMTRLVKSRNADHDAVPRQRQGQ
jgi:hypothetical protein